MLNGKFRAKMSATLTTLLLTLLVATGQAKINQGETFTVTVTFSTTGNPVQPFPSSAEVVQGIQTADYGGGAYFPVAVKITGVKSEPHVEKTFTAKVSFFPSGNLLQPFPSSGEVAQGIQTANYDGGIYFSPSVEIVGESAGSSAAVPVRDPACPTSGGLTITVKTVGALTTDLDEYSCTANEGRWSFGFDAAGAQGKGAIEIRYSTGPLVYVWHHPIVLQNNVVFNGCDSGGMNCWQFEQAKHMAWTCQNCSPLRSYLNLMGTLRFPARLDGAPAPDSVEPNSASTY